MPFIVGVVLALFVGLLATTVRLDRDRAFYPTIAMVVASYYVLFAVMSQSPPVLILETLIALGFMVVALTGFKRSLWLVVAALAGHGIFDFVRGDVIANAGVPVWWPPFCGAFDVAIAVYLAFVLRHRGAVSKTGLT